MAKQFRLGRFRPTLLLLDDVGADNSFPSSDPFFNDKLILAEGDSWFSIGGFPPANLLGGLRFKSSTLIASCASPGDTIVRMANLERNRFYKQALSPRGHAWDMILLSGGGNDLIDDAHKIVKPRRSRSPRDPSEVDGYVNKKELKTCMNKISAGYMTLAELRDGPRSPAQHKPILTHTYDYATPRNEPAKFVGFPLLGPWLYKAFTAQEVPRDYWIDLAKHLMDALAETILSLQADIDDFHVVDTRKTLVPAGIDELGQTKHWLNEIHPNHEGYEALGRVIAREKLYRLLYGSP